MSKYINIKDGKEVHLLDLRKKDNIYYEKGFDKPFTGVATLKHEDGSYRSIWKIKNGLLNGNSYTFFDSGRVRTKYLYKDGEIIKQQVR